MNTLKFSLMALVAALACLCAGGEPSTSGIITKNDGEKLIVYVIPACANMDGLWCWCEPCNEYVLCEEYSGGTNPETDPESSGSSVVNNIFANHHHISYDYKIGKPGAGCAPCGSSGGANSSGLSELAIIRQHRYRESSRGGSFGPGVFTNYDSRLTLYRDNGFNVMEWFNPMDLAARKLVDGTGGDVKDGIYYNQINKKVKDVRLYNASNQLTTDITTAAYAIITRHTGEKQYFQIVNTGAAADSLPVAGAAPWREIDIGRVARTGSTTGSGSAFTLTASGRDIAFQQDEAHYTYQALRGDGSIVARVASLTNTDPNTKAGVMIRESLGDGSRFAMMAATSGNGYQFMRRKTAYTNVTSTDAIFAKPTWVRVVRAGNLFTSYRSDDGSTWSQVSQSTVTMGANAYVGLCVSARNNTVLNTSVFDNISTSTGGTPPWQNADIGAVGVAGSASYNAGTYTVNGSGSDIWAAADSFHYVYQPLTGDGEITARVFTVQNTNDSAKAGVMIRETLAADSPFAMTTVTPLKGTSLLRRLVAGGPVGEPSLYLGECVPGWVKLTRTGNTLTGAISQDGVSWTNVGSDTITFGADVFVGMALSSRKDGYIATGAFDNVALSGTPTPVNEWPPENVQSKYEGRLTKLEDRNGYATTITYKTFTTAELEESPERQLQIDTVTDAYGRAATFTYDPLQQSGLWAIKQINLPNSQTLQYQYADGKLSGVTLPDATQAGFTYGFNTATQCSTVTYDDVAGDGSHRRKTSYLTSNFFISLLDEATAEAVNQSSLLVRMVVNGSDEVTYLNTPQPAPRLGEREPDLRGCRQNPRAARRLDIQVLQRRLAIYESGCGLRRADGHGGIEICLHAARPHGDAARHVRFNDRRPGRHRHIPLRCRHVPHAENMARRHH